MTGVWLRLVLLSGWVAFSDYDTFVTAILLVFTQSLHFDFTVLFVYVFIRVSKLRELLEHSGL